MGMIIEKYGSINKYVAKPTMYRSILLKKSIGLSINGTKKEPNMKQAENVITLNLCPPSTHDGSFGSGGLVVPAQGVLLLGS